MKPEDVIALPLERDGDALFNATEDYIGEMSPAMRPSQQGRTEALVTMCNSYPLALALAEAVERHARLARERGIEQPRYLQSALSAFLAHRNPEATDAR